MFVLQDNKLQNQPTVPWDITVAEPLAFQHRVLLVHMDTPSTTLQQVTVNLVHRECTARLKDLYLQPEIVVPVSSVPDQRRKLLPPTTMYVLIYHLFFVFFNKVLKTLETLLV
jgi:hypothetical protein